MCVSGEADCLTAKGQLSSASTRSRALSWRGIAAKALEGGREQRQLHKHPRVIL